MSDRPGIRSSVLTNTVEFVTARHGPDAHRRVLAALTSRDAAAFVRRTPDGEPRPLGLLVAYMEAARAVLAPDDEEFFVDMGRFAASEERRRGLSHMVDDREVLVRMLPTLWRLYFDRGSFEIVSREERRITGRVVGFRGHPALCQRIGGVAQAHFGAARMEHVACVFEGAEDCRWSLWW